MKSVIADVALKIPIEIEVIDVDEADELREKFGNEVPVLFIDGRKAFKYRVTPKELEKRLITNRWSPFSWIGYKERGA
jgi:hypothetical protein